MCWNRVRINRMPKREQNDGKENGFEILYVQFRDILQNNLQMRRIHEFHIKKRLKNS